MSSENVSQFKKFIESNTDYLKEEYENFFQPQLDSGKKPQIITISDMSVPKIIEYIYEIFSLHHYKENTKTNKLIVESVEDNIISFLKQSTHIKDSDTFDFNILIQILTFVISNNSIFAVQYETQGKKQQQSVNSGSGQQKVGKNLHVNLKKDLEEKSGNANTAIHSAQKLQIDEPNEFDFSAANTIENTSFHTQELIMRNARTIFEFYCKQQMQLGGITTFDQFNQQTSSMTLGKCLTFAKASNLLNIMIPREVLISKFKKVSQGKKAINFEKFYAMISEFQVLDPNFNKRVGLLEEDVRKHLKYIQKPFNTQEVKPREQIAVRSFKKKLTGHSGKTGDILKEEIQEKKRQQSSNKKMQQIRDYMRWRDNHPDFISHKDLKTSASSLSKYPNLSNKKDLSIDLSFIGSLISPEDNDETYLKGHLIDKPQKMTKRKNSIPFTPKRQHFSHDGLQNVRKSSILADMQKRIKELEMKEKRMLSPQQRNMSLNLRHVKGRVPNASPTYRYSTELK